MTHNHEYVTADTLVRVTIDLVDPLQPALPTMPAPRHLIHLHLDPLDCTVNPLAYATGGAWWEHAASADPEVRQLTASVRDGDDHDSVERRVIEAASIMLPGVEWFDLDRIEHEYRHNPEMDDREAAIFAALVNSVMAADNRRWAGLVNVNYRPEGDNDGS